MQWGQKMLGIGKIFFFCFLIVGTFFAQSGAAMAIEVEFDFDDDALPYLSGAAEIEAYMESIYGSEITVIGGIVGNGCFNGPLHDCAGDHYIQAGPGWGTYEFSFSFVAEPISSVSFDWGVRFNRFRVFADNVEIFISPCGWDFWTSDSFQTVFDSPVTTLTFRDSCLGEIEVDNLKVVPVPEPATISMLGICGALAFISRRRTV